MAFEDGEEPWFLRVISLQWALEQEKGGDILVEVARARILRLLEPTRLRLTLTGVLRKCRDRRWWVASAPKHVRPVITPRICKV